VSGRPLVLASASPRRLALLAQIGIVPDRVLATEVDEAPGTGELPREISRRLARAKAEAAAARSDLPPETLVLAADTVVAVGRRSLPKAEDEADARGCLALMSGRSHRVYTAICLRPIDGRPRERVVETRVKFKRLSPAEIDAYLLSGEWAGKAGGYAVQGLAAAFVLGMIGSYSNVVGLPLYETAMLLDGAGYPVRARWAAEGGR